VAQIQEYKCPCCGGSITFDSASQNMKCPYCDTEFLIETLEEYNKEISDPIPEDDMKWNTSERQDWSEEELKELRSYVCVSCGGEIIGDGTLGATTCPFCGNAVIMPEQFSGALKPDYVIPFKLSKDDAKTALKNHYKGKKFLPKVFKDQNHIDEIKGVYVPVWLYDADVDANIRYKATVVRVWSDSRYDYTETNFFSVRRAGNVGFERVPVDGSTKINNDLMESIEPFDFSEAVDFNTAYLSGYLADRYDVDSKTSIENANSRIKKSTEDVFASTVIGYTTVFPEASSVQLKNGEAKYALYPVWLLNTSWKGNTYSFAMNGQSGKVAGDLPFDKGAFWRWTIGLTGIFSAIAFGISCLIGLL